ncbi:MAG TPA: energy transducer TonB, partial [Puia sp.]
NVGSSLIFIKFKNRKEAVVKITDEMRKSHKSAGSSRIFTKVEIESEYPGGTTGWVDYLIKNLKYPAGAAEKGIQGDVVVQFIVEADGSLTDIHAESGPEPLRPESERVIRESGRWIPAKNNGKVVRAYKKQPIIYKLKSS